jgi:hypothetical protein
MTVGEIKEELETIKKLRGDVHKLEEEGQFQKKHVQSIIFDRKYNWTSERASDWASDSGYAVHKIETAMFTIKIEQKPINKKAKYTNIKSADQDGITFLVKVLEN